MERRRKTDLPPGEWGVQNIEVYRRAWSSYVVRRNLVVVLFLSFLLVGALVAKLQLGELKDFGVLAFWIAVYLTGTWWLTEWRCPRCGKIFANRLWTRQCISCGLTKDEVAARARMKI